jgi:hypothetical protein
MPFSLPFSKAKEKGLSPRERDDTIGGSDSVICLNGRTIQKSTLYEIPLLLLNCSFGVVRPAEMNGVLHEPVGLKEIGRRQRSATDSDITIVHVVRNPGLDSCREQAQRISTWASTPSSSIPPAARRLSVNLACVVKDSGTPAADEALLEFYEEYFHHPIYKDTKSQLFKALGSRKLPIWNKMSPWRQRRKSSNTEALLKCDAWMFGGLLILDKRGELRHVVFDAAGEMFDTDELDRKLAEIRLQDQTEDSSSFHVSSSEPEPTSPKR